ncbi:MAG: McrC family protein [Ignavibacteriaceae bacterium]
MKNHNVLQVFEHEFLSFDDGIRNKDFYINKLIKYGDKTNYKYFRVYNRRIKFSNFVGIIQINSLTIEVLPKVDREINSEDSKKKCHDILIFMLKECKQIKLDAISNALLKIKSLSLLDLYYDVFLSELESIVRGNLKKNYRRVQENLNKVKGQINFPKHIAKNYIHQEKCYSEHTVYDKNNLINQILFKALNRLNNFIYNSKYAIRIKKLLFAFEGVSDISITDKTFDKIVQDRNSQRYKTALNIAKLILLNQNPDIQTGTTDILAILFDMNKLFELYITRQLIKAANEFSKINLQVNSQVSKKFWKRKNIIPDIILQYAQNNEMKKIIVDTKWKMLKNNSPSDEDLRQIFTYNIHFGSNGGVLIYPNANNQALKDQFYHKSELMSDEYSHYCNLYFVDLLNEKGQLDRSLGSKILQDLIFN